MGIRARQRVERCFTEARLTVALRVYYERLLQPATQAS
jgi:hypothetical protein